MKKALLNNSLVLCLAVCCLLFIFCGQSDYSESTDRQDAFVSGTEVPGNVRESSAPVTGNSEQGNGTTVSMNRLPQYYGKPYVEIDGNQPGFTEQDKTKESFEKYSDLDSLGRCGVAYANIGLI